MKDKVEKLKDWFNPMEFDHILAYKHIRDTGTIPTHIVPSNTQIGPQSFGLMTEKMARYWIFHMEYMRKKLERIENETNS